MIRDRNKLKNSEHAISTVVSVILLLGLAVAMVAVFNVSYVPDMKTAAEFDHMGDVYEDMSRIKSNGDIMAIAMAIDNDIFFSMDMPVRMGGGYIPIIGRERSSSTLVVNDATVGMYITAEDQSNGTVYNYVLDDLGSIRYSSNNRYFMDQSFVLENGALFIVQGNRSLMKLPPSMRMDLLNGSHTDVRISVVDIFGNTGSVASNDVEYVRMESNSSNVLFNKDRLLKNMSVTIISPYPLAWSEHLDSMAAKAGLVSPAEYDVTTSNNNVTLSLYSGNNESIGLYLQEHIIDTRLNSVWVPY
ncbi:hypothetical protein HNV12_09080 [Methanococcoides sp. SA1]|nr:hypothetical protein [Methanococcoides sp. SA1]